jgi:hypothetical protein
VYKNTRSSSPSAVGECNTVQARVFAFKIQGSIEWMDLTFADVWTSISWSPTLKVKYSNLLILVEIAKCQCVSTATCERLFSVQNTIKQKLRNRMSTSNLESMMRVAIEGPNNDFDDILTSALNLRKDDAKCSIHNKYLLRPISI